MSLGGINALVVDDEPMNLTVATSIFERYGMKTDTALSGQEAIDMCKEKKYDIVFMDHMMPQMDGIETVRRIRLEAGLNRQDTAFVALTANAVSTAREMFASEGFDGFVSKPIVLAELERVLRNVFPASAISYEGDDAAEAGLTENKTGERPQSRDPMDVLREAGIAVESGLDYCMDDKELYREVLMEYAMDGESRISELDGYYAAADWENFKIRVHAVKSSSKTIGADRLSRSAAMLEQSSADENEGAIKALYPEFLSEYRRISGVIKELYGEDSK
jgi:CheY-like chemotaxis protein